MIDRLSSLRGRVRVTNADGFTYESSNLVVYGGGDIIARLLAGYTEYRISHMLFAYHNTAGTADSVVPARTDTVANKFTALNGTTKDYIRASVLSPAQMSASGVNYSSNQATFVAIANAVTGVKGLAFGAGSNSKVNAIGIVAAPTGAAAGDVLYAHFGLSTAVPAVGSNQVTATWTLEAD